LSHTLIYGFDEQLARWACDRIPWAEYNPNMRAVGVADGDDASAQLLAVCVYHNYAPIKMIDGVPWYGICEIAMAAASPRWATRRTITNLLWIPFRQYNCRKVVTVIPSSNERAISFNKGIGLKWEASLRHHFAKGVHAQIHGMMKSEYEARWLKPRPARRSAGSGIDGQGHTLGAAAD
jgi:RimJ/RimL family protein N-acetyltransferase